ncbi:hypothetical protein AVEN_237638-1, partial [Araneus ventricosus]
MSRETSSFTANVEGVSVENSAEIGCGLRSDVTDRGRRPGSKKLNAIARPTRGMRPGSKKLNSIILLYEKKRTIKDGTHKGIPSRIAYRTDKEDFIYIRVSSHF